MPSIEITDEQAQQLANGENIVVPPAPEPKRLLAVSNSGAIYEIFDAVQRDTAWYGAWTIVRYSSGTPGIGNRHAAGGFPLAIYQFIEVER